MEGSWGIFEVDNIEGREDEQQRRGQKQNGEMIKYCAAKFSRPISARLAISIRPHQNIGLSQFFPSILCSRSWHTEENREPQRSQVLLRTRLLSQRPAFLVFRN